MLEVSVVRSSPDAGRQCIVGLIKARIAYLKASVLQARIDCISVDGLGRIFPLTSTHVQVLLSVDLACALALSVASLAW